MSRYNESQNVYIKEIFQKVPENSAGSRPRLDFPTTRGMCSTSALFLLVLGKGSEYIVMSLIN